MLDRFFNDSLASRSRVSSFSPQVDAYETEKSYEIEVSLPGLKRDDIKVDFQQGRLSISGERSFHNEQDQRRYHVVESSYGSFQRSFQLPDTVDASKIEARFDDGVLHVSVPKDEQKTMRHQIQVGGGQSSGNRSGQLSDRMGQQATDVPVQEDGQPSDSNRSQASGQSQSDSAKTAANGKNQAAAGSDKKAAPTGK